MLLRSSPFDPSNEEVESLMEYMISMRDDSFNINQVLIRYLAALWKVEFFVVFVVL